MHWLKATRGIRKANQGSAMSDTRPPRSTGPSRGPEARRMKSYNGNYKTNEADSEDVELNDELIPGSGKRAQQLKFLKPFAEKLKQKLNEQLTGEMSFAGATRFLKKLANFDDTAELYRLPTAGRIIKFMRLFAFEIKGSGPGMSVRRPATAAGAAGGRPAGSVDIAPRAPRRGLPAGTAITWQPDNPYRGGTSSFTRFELYKGASTIGETRSLGATPQDIKNGLAKSFGQINAILDHFSNMQIVASEFFMQDKNEKSTVLKSPKPMTPVKRSLQTFVQTPEKEAQQGVIREYIV